MPTSGTHTTQRVPLRARHEHHPAGTPVAATTPGDFALTHGHTWISRSVRTMQAIRFRGTNHKYAYWNHAALIVGPQGEIVEAHGHGVRKANLNHEYLAREVTIVRLDYSTTDRQQAVAFAESCVGEGYGFVTILGLTGWVLFGGRLVVAAAGTEICSGLVADSLVRCGPIFPRPPIAMMPADLALFYNVDPPTSPADLLSAPLATVEQGDSPRGRPTVARRP